MILRICSLFDSKAGVYGQPFFARSAGEAIRSVTDALRHPDATIARYPSDYTLFEIGTFDDQTAIISIVTPISLGNLVEYAPAPVPQTANIPFPVNA